MWREQYFKNPLKKWTRRAVCAILVDAWESLSNAVLRRAFVQFALNDREIDNDTYEQSEAPIPDDSIQLP